MYRSVVVDFVCLIISLMTINAEIKSKKWGERAFVLPPSSVANPVDLM